MYAVIEFSPQQGGGLSVVNKKWLTPRKKEVFWPPYKDASQFEKSLKKAEEINTETWRLYSVHRIFYETDSFEKAQQKVKKAEVTSDLQSESENSNIRRKRVKPIRYLSTDSDDSEYTERNLPKPPSIKKNLFKNTPTSSESASLSIDNSITQDDIFRQQINVIHETTETPTNSKVISEKLAFENLLVHVIEIKNQNKKIISLLSQIINEKTVPKGNYPEDLPVKFPLRSLQEINLTERYLENNDKFKELSAYYSTLGGKDTVSKTNRILRETLDDQLACHFNFYGRKTKEAFSRLKLNEVVISAVKSTCNSTSKDVEEAVKVWLKHAPQRVKKNRA